MNNFDEVNEVYPIVDEFYCDRSESWCGDCSDCENCPLCLGE